MAWRYPLYMIQDGYVVDNIAINENLLSVTEESSGYLNEHNFEIPAEGYITRSNLKTGAGISLYYKVPASPPASNAPFEEIITPPTATAVAVTSTTPGVVAFEGDTFKTSNQAGLTLTFTSRGGPTWICASFTLANTVKSLSYASVFDNYYAVRHGGDTTTSYDGAHYPLPKQKGFGVSAALQLDGVLLNGTVVGTADAANEYYGDSNQDKHTSVSVSYMSTKSKAGGGISGAWNAVVLDTVVDLSPGVHTVKVALMDIRSSNRTTYGKDADYSTQIYVTTRELFAVELTQ